jgi:hypothetical protein
MRPTDAGLVVEGEVDRETDQGRQVWRSIKSGVTGFSIGYMSESRPRKGGGRTLTEIDLLEISATVRPMHPSARVLDWKSAGRDHTDDHLVALFNGSSPPPRPPEVPPELVGTPYDWKTSGEILAAKVIDAEVKAHRKATLKAKPIRVASFKV